MDEEKFLELASLLNVEQKSFSLEIMSYERKRLNKLPVKRIYPILCGGAGTGKTLVVKCSSMPVKIIQINQNRSSEAMCLPWCAYSCSRKKCRRRYPAYPFSQSLSVLWQ